MATWVDSEKVAAQRARRAARRREVMDRLYRQVTSGHPEDCACDACYHQACCEMDAFEALCAARGSM